MKKDTKHIIKDCCKGKREAQEKLYKLFSDKMFGVCLRYTNDYDEAQDILQDGFVIAFQKIHQLKNENLLEAWIRRIMINEALKRYREKQRTGSVDELIEQEKDARPDAVQEMGEQELLKLVQSLSPQYRMVFNLYAIEGYSHKEISQMLDISEGTSKSNLSRARVILQEKIASMQKVEPEFIKSRYGEG